MEEQYRNARGRSYGDEGSAYDGGEYRPGQTDGSTTTHVKEQAEQIKQRASEKIDEAKEKMADYGRRAADRVNAERESAAGKLEDTASMIHQRGDRIAGAASRAAHMTADKVQATADYLRDHDLKDMLEDFSGVVRRHPGPALAAAAVVGFLAGRAILRTAR